MDAENWTPGLRKSNQPALLIAEPPRQHLAFAVPFGGLVGFDLVLFLLTYLLWFSETGFLCVIALAVLELALVDQAGLELTEILLPLPPECWD